MSEITISQAQANMRNAYFSGAAGVLVSGCVWLTAGLVATLHPASTAVFVLLIGGALIHPLSVVLCKILGRTGTHERGNPLGLLAIEGTVWLLAGIAVAYGMHVLRAQWFFPAMLLVIGGRYMTFQSLYGLRIYWLCGVALIFAGVALALAMAPSAVSALVGAAIELIFATLIFVQNKRGSTS
jgi:hypothetical protein